MKAQQIPAAVRTALAERSGGVCERDACGRAAHAHHRRPRGMGGSREWATNSLANLLHVSRKCHDHIESYRSESYDKGWLVKQGVDPMRIPVRYRDYPRPMFLTPDGLIHEASDAELIALFGKGYEGVA